MNIMYPGQIVFEEGYYYDQLCGKECISGSYENWYWKTVFESHIYNTYKLTLQEYYNLIMFGDKDHIPKCGYVECNEPARWTGYLSKGYTKGCCTLHGNYIAWQDEERRKTQSELFSDIAYHKMMHLWYDDTPDAIEFRKTHSEKQSKLMTKLNKENWDDPEYREAKIIEKRKWMADKRNKIQLDAKHALSWMEGDFGFIYIMRFEDKIKIGVSSTLDRCRQRLRRLYGKSMIIFQGDCYEVVDMEASIKLEFESIEGTLEYFDKSYYEIFRDKLNKFKFIEDTLLD